MCMCVRYRPLKVFKSVLKEFAKLNPMIKYSMCMCVNYRPKKGFKFLELANLNFKIIGANTN